MLPVCREGDRQQRPELFVAGAHRWHRHPAPMPRWECPPVNSSCQCPTASNRLLWEAPALNALPGWPAEAKAHGNRQCRSHAHARGLRLNCTTMCDAGIVNFGVQAMLFTFLLYALLAAETDPLSYTIKVLVGWLRVRCTVRTGHAHCECETRTVRCSSAWAQIRA